MTDGQEAVARWEYRGEFPREKSEATQPERRNARSTPVTPMIPVPAKDYEALYPAEEYHEDLGPVLWWHLPVCEPPTVGVIDDYENANGHLTHFSLMPIVWDGCGRAKRVESLRNAQDVAR